MTDASPQPGARQPQARHLLALFTILAIVPPVLCMISLFVFAYASIPAVEQQPPGPLALLSWAAAWLALVIYGLGAGVAPGFVLSVHPEVLAPQAGFSITRRWPRRTGAALVWAGMGIVALAVPPLIQVNAVAHGTIPPFNFVAWAVIGVAALAPLYALSLAGRFVRRAPRGQSDEREAGD